MADTHAPAGASIDGLPGPEQVTARLRAFVDHQHPGTGVSGGMRRGESGGAGADHQDVAVRPGLVVGVRVGPRGSAGPARLPAG